MYTVAQTSKSFASIAVDAQNTKENFGMSNYLDKNTLSILEYDLNVFYAENWSEEKGTTWEDVYTIQPSIYYVVKDTWASSRVYMKSFKLTLAETRAIAPDFPEEEWGSDFFIGLEHFTNTCKALPDSVRDKLALLPNLDMLDIDPDASELEWIN
jgi:hypothetical protein